MGNHDVGTVQGAVQVQAAGYVAVNLHTRRQSGAFLQYGGAALFLKRIQPAPAVLWLVHGHLMTLSAERPGHAAEKMRVAVIPARGERMIEQHEFHGRASGGMR